MKRSLPLLALLGILVASACGDPQPVRRPGEKFTCNGEERIQLDCSSEVKYQGAKGEAQIEVMSIAKGSGSFEQTALRRVSDQMQEYIGMQTRACRDYNACIVSAQEYRGQAADIRRRIMTIPALTEALKNAKGERERMKALDQLYRGIVPEEKRVEELTFHMGMNVTIPDNLGGGSFPVSPGATVPTGAKVHFNVSTSKKAYVYMFQATPRGELSVLFPEPRIGTRNPLPGGLPTRLPPAGQSFKVNSKDLGIENVYVVVSQEPIEDLDAALNQVKSGEVKSLTGNPMLRRLSRVAPAAKAEQCKSRALELSKDEEGDPCTRPRGLELEDDASGSGAAPKRGLSSMAVRTDPGDDRIVRVFPFQHVTAKDFKRKSRGGSGTTGKTRGIAIED